MREEFDESQLPHILPLYYRRLFPHLQLYRWLSYGHPYNFSHREISFTLFGDIYLRYQSFDHYEAFANELIKKSPIKIDIGAIYNTVPRDKRKARDFFPKEREIIFDIDMTDYDPIRTCCSGTDVCKKCWKFMVIACKILDSVLREDFGCKHLLFVFSGRRGVHCWVGDTHFRKMDNEARSCILQYTDLVVNSGRKDVHLNGEKLHTSLKRAINIVDKYFPTLLKEQDFFGTEERLNKLLDIIDEIIRPHFEEPLKKAAGSEDRWQIFLKIFSDLLKKGMIPKHLKFLREEIKLMYSYPRLDRAVTAGMNHLLKAPFCVHPKCGKISVPFHVKFVDRFDPDQVPTLTKIIEEINEYDKKTQEQEETVKTDDLNFSTLKKIRDYKKTSLLKYVAVFDEFLKGLDEEMKNKSEKSTIMDF